MRQRNRRQQILDAAQKLIEEGGFTRLTTREIAQKAGCAEGTLFKYFRRKEELCLAVVLENSPNFHSAVAKKQPGQGAVRANLEDIALAAVRLSEKLIPLAASLFADVQLLERHRLELSRTGGGPTEAFRQIAAYISAEQELGRVNSAVDASAVAALLLGSCFHRAFLHQGLGYHIYQTSDQKFAKVLVGTLMKGLRSIDK